MSPLSLDQHYQHHGIVVVVVVAAVVVIVGGPLSRITRVHTRAYARTLICAHYCGSRRQQATNILSSMEDPIISSANDVSAETSPCPGIYFVPWRFQYLHAFLQDLHKLHANRNYTYVSFHSLILALSSKLTFVSLRGPCGSCLLLRPP